MPETRSWGEEAGDHPFNVTPATHGVGGQPGTDTGDPVSNQRRVEKKREVEREKSKRHGTRHM